MAEKKLTVVITGVAKGAQAAFSKVSSSADGMGAKLQTVGAGVGKVFKAASVGAGVLAVGVGAFLKGGVDSLIELERLGAQTESVIKATGGAAGVTADQVAAYADSIEKATGVEAEGIISGQNMLLTFKNVKNEVGAGNDIFNQATDIMTDMSVAMGTDASKTAVQLGKALNDPIAGISALSKVGVTFTDQQKAQIKAMVEAGDVAGAQKIILAELNSEFGGSAEAFGDTTAGKVAKLKNLFGDFQEALASKLLPVIEKIVGWLQDKLPVAQAAVQDGLAKLAPKVDDLATSFMGVVDAVRPVVEAIARFVAANPAPVLAALGAVAVVAFGAWAVTAGAAALATLAAIAPILLVGAAVAALAGGFVYAYQHFEGFRNVVDGVVQWLTGTAWPAIQSFAALVAEGFGMLVGWVQDHWGQIKGYIEGAINTVAAVVGAVIDGLKVAWQTWGDELVTIAQTMWGYIKGTVENGINLVKGVIDVVMGIIRGDWSQAWDGIKGVLGAVWDQIKLAVSTGVELVKTVLSAAWDAIKLAASTAWDGFKKVISDAIDGAVEFAKAMPGRIVGAVGNMGDKLYQAGKDLIAGLVRGIRDAIPDVASVLSSIPGIGAIGGAINIPGFAAGGRPPVGRLSLVGERGPELFVPDQAGTIIPSAATRSMLGRSSGGSQGGVQIIVQGTVLDGRQLGQLAAEGLNEYARSQNRPVLVGVT